jgi:pyruvate formate lyase activating enzyme
LKKGKKWKINIETSLNVPKTFVELMKDVIDHWIVDIKDINPNIYKAYTGKDNKQVISNLQYLIDNNAKITARVPLIAGFNTELDVKNSILSLERMGIIDIDRFTYTVKEH